jgi:integrase/recombinase XerC
MHQPAAPSAPLPIHAKPPGIDDLVAAFLSGKAPITIVAYKADLTNFAAFVGATSTGDAADALLGAGHGQANLLGLRYRAHLLEAKLSPATVNRRLTALRSLVTLARTLGMIPWTLDLSGVKAQRYRDTRGPGVGGFRALIRMARNQAPAKAARDVAILALLFGLALRRNEVVTLDVDHWSPTTGTVLVLGKGKTERESLTVPAPVRAALEAWLPLRGDVPGALFTSMDRAGQGDGRLTADGLHKLVRGIGQRVGITVRPHGLRHAAITHALDITGGDVRSVQRFSRHASVQTLVLYDDAREDLGGKVASQVAAAIAG